MAQEIDVFKLGSAGGSLKITVKERGSALNISTATNLVVRLKPPHGDLITKTGVLFDGGSTGIMGYTFTEADLKKTEKHVREYVGLWHAEADFTLGSWAGPVQTVQFRVEDSLEPIA